ncbi:MAG TPA: glycosyltransferase family 2 protein [Terriglobales bacterium]|nr:glycosyltransferase family 2 protein [Terriglobales bacterium]
MSLSVVIVTKNEEANLARTLESVRWADEIIVVDSGSTDRTVAIAHSFGAKVFVEDWKGYAAQKNSALDKATMDWVLALDADEVVEPELAGIIQRIVDAPPTDLENLRALSDTMHLSFQDRRFLRSMVKQHDTSGEQIDPNAGFVAFRIPFKHYFWGQWIRHGGFYPDRKIRLFKRGHGRFGARAVHESIQVSGGPTASLNADIAHHGYPTLEGYLASMDRYSSLAAEQMVAEGRRPTPFVDTTLRPIFTFIGRYFFRFGILDGGKGLLFNFHHSRYVRAKYSKALALLRAKEKEKKP